ncbi:MAG: flagellar basal body rod protein FlgB [Syntrophobacterales bacterium]|nr:MAG: flagellar basal body rod protein FlgB [Syntrophobacterales bacterium]
MDALFGKTIDMLSAMLDFRSERHKIISSNITNLDTPDYLPKELTFREALRGVVDSGGGPSMTVTDKRHLSERSAAEGEVTVSGDKVDIDDQMAKMAENQLMYNFSVDLMARKFRGLNAVLKEAK